MVRVRLKRTGTRNASCFRVVVMDQRSSRDGKAIEELGFYDPRKKEEKINVERANYWKGVGAEFSDTVEAILNRAKEGRNLKDIVKKPSISIFEEGEGETRSRSGREGRGGSCREGGCRSSGGGSRSRGGLTVGYGKSRHESVNGKILSGPQMRRKQINA